MRFGSQELFIDFTEFKINEIWINRNSDLKFYFNLNCSKTIKLWKSNFYIFIKSTTKFKYSKTKTGGDILIFKHYIQVLPDILPFIN